MVTAASEVQSGLLPLMGAPGFRFFKDLYPDSRSGGLNYYPYSAIKSGFDVSWSVAAAAPALAPAAMTVAVQPGRALIDSQDAVLASAVNIVFTPEEVFNGENFFRIFAAPTRVIQPVVALNGVYSAPTTRLNGDPIQDGDGYVECVDFPQHLEAHNFYKMEAGVWKSYDPAFETSTYPVQQGRNRVYGNGTHRKLTLSNFMVNALEVPIYIATQFPIFGYQPARANLRNPASLEVATAKLYYHVLPLDLTATFTNGSDQVIVEYAYRGIFNDLVASITDTAALAIDGAALATAGYDPTTGAITLAAPYAGTDGSKQVVVTPSTPDQNYILSPGLSELIPSENLTNP